MIAPQLLCFVLLAALCQADLRVVGNLAVVATPLSHVGTEAHPAKAVVPQLWCAVHNLGEQVEIKYGQFTRQKDGKIFEGTLKDNKVYLSVGKVPVTVAGKYSCEVRTEDDEILSGNSFIYLPPVLRLPNGSEFSEQTDARPPRVVGNTKEVNSEDELTLRCPVFGYPQPFVRWEKDGQPISGGSIMFDGDDITIPEVSSSDAGVYKCIADNSFPMFVDGPAMPHSVVYEQTVVVK